MTTLPSSTNLAAGSTFAPSSPSAGLLDGRRAVTHWLCTEELQGRYPDVTVDPCVLHVVYETIPVSQARGDEMNELLAWAMQRLRLARRLLETSEDPIELVAHHAAYETREKDVSDRTAGGRERTRTVLESSVQCALCGQL